MKIRKQGNTAGAPLGEPKVYVVRLALSGQHYRCRGRSEGAGLKLPGHVPHCHHAPQLNDPKGSRLL